MRDAPGRSTSKKRKKVYDTPAEEGNIFKKFQLCKWLDTRQQRQSVRLLFFFFSSFFPKFIIQSEFGRIQFDVQRIFSFPSFFLFNEFGKKLYCQSKSNGNNLQSKYLLTYFINYYRYYNERYYNNGNNL